MIFSKKQRKYIGTLEKNISESYQQVNMLTDQIETMECHGRGLYCPKCSKCVIDTSSYRRVFFFSITEFKTGFVFDLA